MIKKLIFPLLIFCFSLYFYSQIYKSIPIRYWDEYYWVARSYYFELFIKKDFDNELWFTTESYDQPKLAEYIYGLVLYPKFIDYKRKIKLNDNNYDLAKFLIDNNFYSIESKKYENYKNLNRNYINWGKDPQEVFDVSFDFLIKKFSSSINKTIDLIFSARKANVLFLSFTSVIVYFLALNLSGSLVVSLLFVLFYGTNIYIIESALRAHSEGLFLLLFDLSLLFILFFFNKKYSIKYGMLFFISSALLTTTKLNGVMLTIIFNILLFSLLLSEGFNRNILRTIIFGNTIFFVIFIFHHPLLMKNPMENVFLIYKHRLTTTIDHAKAEPSSVLATRKSRVLSIFNNYLGDRFDNFNNYFLIRRFIKNNKTLVLWVYRITFIFGFITFFKRKWKKYWYFGLIFLLTIWIMSFYLLLNWDRYFVHLTFFFIFFQCYGLVELIKNMFHLRFSFKTIL